MFCQYRAGMMIPLSFGFLLWPVSFAIGDDELFNGAVQGHKQLVQLMTGDSHFVAERTSSYHGKLRERQTMEWWQRNNDVRASVKVVLYDKTELSKPEEESASSFDFEYGRVGNRQVKTTIIAQKDRQPQKNANIAGVASRNSPGVSIWVCTGNVGLSYPTETWLYEALLQPGKLRTCKRIVEDGAALILIEKSLAKQSFRVMFDPKRMFYPVKSWLYLSDEPSQSTLSSTCEVRGFHPRDAATGIYFPTEVVSKAFKDGKPYLEATTTISVAEFDKPLPAESYRLAIPAGYSVVDELNDRAYRSGLDGSPDGDYRVTKLSDLGIPKVYSPPPPEPNSWRISYRWITLCLSLTLFAVALWIRRSKRKSGATA